MQISLFKLYFMILILAIGQLLINNLSPLYLDIIGIAMIVLLVNGVYSLRLLVIIGLCADLIGHWYLGTHLLAVILISFITSRMVNFYRMSWYIQKIIIIDVLFSLLCTINTLIGFFAHNLSSARFSHLVEIAIISPIILWLFNHFIIKVSADVIIQDG